jgi:hypothetical protein
MEAELVRELPEADGRQYELKFADGTTRQFREHSLRLASRR